MAVSIEVKHVLDIVLDVLRDDRLQELIPSGEIGAQMLLNGDISADIRDSVGKTPLYVLVTYLGTRKHQNGVGDIFPRALSVLVALGADIDAKTFEGNTALLQAVKLGWFEGSKILLDFGANVEEPDNHGDRPLVAVVGNKNE